MLNGIDGYTSSKLSGVPAQILITGTILNAKVAYRDFNEADMRNQLKNILTARGWSVDSIEAKAHPTIANAALFWIVVNGNTSDNLNTVVRNFQRHIIFTTQQVGAEFLTKPAANISPLPVQNNPVTNSGQGANNIPQSYPDFWVKAQGVYKNWTGNPDENALLLSLQSQGFGVKELKIKQKSDVGILSTLFPPKLIADTFGSYIYNIDIILSGSQQSTDEISRKVKEHLETQFSDIKITTVKKKPNDDSLDSDSFKTLMIIGFAAIIGIIIIKK